MFPMAVADPVRGQQPEALQPASKIRHQGGTYPDRPAITPGVEATMTKGDHMAAKHIPQTPRLAGLPSPAYQPCEMEPPQ
jgi:hypothetical protein